MGACVSRLLPPGGNDVQDAVNVANIAADSSQAVSAHSTVATGPTKSKNLVTPLPSAPKSPQIEEAQETLSHLEENSAQISPLAKAPFKKPTARQERSLSVAPRGRSEKNVFTASSNPKEDLLGALPGSTTRGSTRHRSVMPPQLAHRGSRGNVLDFQLHSSKGKRRPKKPVNVSLDVLHRDVRARLGFFKYLEITALSEQMKQGDQRKDHLEEMQHKRRASKSTSSRVTADYREDCVLFWLEVSDLLKIPSGGTFQLGLMQDLFEVYIANGAPRLLPMISIAERDPLMQHLQDLNVERSLMCYKMLLLDVLEVITTHFDEFVRDDSTLGYNYVTKSASMRNVLSRLARDSVNSSKVDRRSHLNKIVNTPVLCRLFRVFLESRSSVENFLFVLDALAFEDLVNTFVKEPKMKANNVQDGSHEDYCLRQAQKIFNKYIRYGSKAEICLSGAVKAKLLQDIVEYPLGAEIFNEAVLLCSAELVNSHLDAFYNSSRYIQYQASISGQQQGVGTGRMRSGSSAVKKPATNVPDGGDGNESIDESNAGPTLPNSVNGHPGNDVPLQVILNGGGAQYFRNFLREEGAENLLLFYKEVAEFQLLPHSQIQYIQSKARKIFDKFVRRGGKLEIELPIDVRRSILWKLSNPSEHTFTEAQKYILSVWERQHMVKFRRHRLYGDLLTYLQTNTNRTDSFTGTDGAQKPSALNSTANAASNGGGELVDVSTITLREFLEIELLRHYFRMFLEKEQCLNELYLYFEILTFQQFPTSDYLTRQARKLFHRFCDPRSRENVTLEESIRADIEASLVNPSPAMFNKAQEAIYQFFSSTLFPKFQHSEIYGTIRLKQNELQLAKLATLGGNLFNNRNTTILKRNVDVSSSVDASGSKTGRIRTTSVPNLGGVLIELTDAMVTVNMILEHPEARALFLFFSEEMYVNCMQFLSKICQRLTR